MSINLTTNYAGKFAGAYIAEAILRGKMLDENPRNMTKFLALKSKMNVPVMLLNGVIKPYTKNFVASGEVVYSERVLDPNKFSVQLEFDIDVLEQMYESEKMAAGMANSNMIPDLQTFVTQYIQTQIQNEMDNFIWNSDTAGSGTLAQIDGLFKLMNADADVVDVVAAAHTKASIIAEFEKVYGALPEKIAESSSLRFFMPVASGNFLKMAIGSNGVESQNRDIDTNFLYAMTNRIVTVPNFPANTIAATDFQNLFFGTDLESDMQTYQLIDLRQTTGDRVLRLRMDFKADVNYAFGNQVVLAQTA